MLAIRGCLPEHSALTFWDTRPVRGPELVTREPSLRDNFHRESDSKESAPKDLSRRELNLFFITSF